MKLFILKGVNSRFIEIRKDHINLFTQQTPYVFDYEITRPRLARWIASGELTVAPDTRKVWYSLYEYMGKPYSDFEKWLEELMIDANQLGIAKIEQISVLSDFTD